MTRINLKRQRIMPGIISLLILLPIYPGISKASEIYPLGPDLFNFDYQRLDREAVIDQSFLPPTGPFRIVVFEDYYPGFKSNSGAILETTDRDDSTIRLFGQFAERGRRADDIEFNDLPYFNGGFIYKPLPSLTAISFFNLDRGKALDDSYSGKVYRGLAGQVETSVLNFHKGKFNLTLGRQRIFWGPRPVNLIFSTTSEPLDMFSATFSSGRLNFNFILARLDQVRPDAVDSVRFPGRTFTDNRYIAAHRLDIRLHRRFRIGLFETTLFGGEGRSPELYYLNPLNFFHATQLNDGVDDNTMLGVDFIAYPGWGSSLYGQLLVDDFQIDNKEQADQEPNEIGFMAGIFKAGQVKTFWPDVRLEYTRLTNRTYHNREPRNRYLYRNRPIGQPLGPDADSLALTLSFWPNNDFVAEIEAAYRRKGEGSLYKPWDEPWLLTKGNYEEPFPTGVVEKALLLSFRTRGYLPLGEYASRHIYFSLEAGSGKIENYLNTPNSKKDIYWFDVSLSWQGWLDLSVD